MMTFNDAGSGTGNACYQCKDRFVGCHATCQRYKAFKEEVERNKREAQRRATLDDYARHIPNPRGRK